MNTSCTTTNLVEPKGVCMHVCVFCYPIYSGRQNCGWMRLPGSHRREVTQDFHSHFPSAVLAFIFIARRIQPSISLVDREVDFVDSRNNNHSRLVRHYCFCLFIFVRKNASWCDCTEGGFFAAFRRF